MANTLSRVYIRDSIISSDSETMKYLFKVIPIPIRAWVKILIGALWIAEASIETQAWYAFAPIYLQQIINPISVIVFVSTYFAVFFGALHLGLGVAQAIAKFKKKYASFEGDT